MRHLPLLLLFACGGSAVSSSASAPQAAATERPALQDLSLTALDGEPIAGKELVGSVLLVVNVASKCGFTPQYTDLQQLHETYAERGLKVLGVPCNQFAGQEPGSADQIQDFCEKNYGVSFTILEKQDVNGKDRSDLYRFLIDSEVGAGKRVKWNFEKFLVNRQGEVVGRWGSRTKPEDPELIQAIEAAL